MGNINLKAGSLVHAGYWGDVLALNPAPPLWTTPPVGPGMLNLNPPVGFTRKVWPTFNNDQLYPVG